MDTESLLQAINAGEATAIAAPRPNVNRPAVQVSVEHLLTLMKRLQEEESLSFDLLMDHTAVDWPDRGCLELIYNLYSTSHNQWLVVSTCVPRDNPVAPTVSGLWPTAHWQEREAYDLLGVLYDNHTDLRRVFLEDSWTGHPLRKDYRDEHMLERPE